jgi:hypothetical protein
MDELVIVCNRHERLIFLVYAHYFVRNHHNNLSSNDHLTFDDRFSMLIMIVDVQEEANHDNHVVLNFDQDEQDVDHWKKSNHGYRRLDLVVNVYRNPEDKRLKEKIPFFGVLFT